LHESLRHGLQDQVGFLIFRASRFALQIAGVQLILLPGSNWGPERLVFVLFLGRLAV
jgi:hypothetical protein